VSLRRPRTVNRRQRRKEEKSRVSRKEPAAVAPRERREGGEKERCQPYSFLAPRKKRLSPLLSAVFVEEREKKARRSGLVHSGAKPAALFPSPQEQRGKRGGGKGGAAELCRGTLFFHRIVPLQRSGGRAAAVSISFTPSSSPSPFTGKVPGLLSLGRQIEVTR